MRADTSALDTADFSKRLPIMANLVGHHFQTEKVTYPAESRSFLTHQLACNPSADECSSLSVQFQFIRNVIFGVFRYVVHVWRLCDVKELAGLSISFTVGRTCCRRIHIDSSSDSCSPLCCRRSSTPQLVKLSILVTAPVCVMNGYHNTTRST